MTSRFKHASHEVAGVKTKVLAAASTILAAQGIEDLNLRAIAESAGIGISSIYHYFAGKEDLLLSLAVMGFEDLRVSIIHSQSNREHLTPIAAGARAYFGFAEERPALFSLMFSERLMARHEVLRDAEQKTLLAYKSAIEADSRFPAAQRAHVAVALWALGRGIAAIMSSQPDGRLPPAFAAELWDGVSYLLNHPE